MSPPTAFISYSYDDDDHRQWVKDLAIRLRADGVDVTLDRWSLVPGDQLPQFMETAIRDNDYVLIVCTPRYKLKSDARIGGVGYEGDIITAAIFQTQNHRKFIPIVARGTAKTSLPTSIEGKMYVDLSQPAGRDSAYQDLISTLLGNRPQPPPIGTGTNRSPVADRSPTPNIPAPSNNLAATVSPEAPLKIVGIVLDEVTEPRMDNTPGSALYRIPFKLSRTPSDLWVELFLMKWDRPPQFTSMHRPGIASVVRDRIILDGTSIEEVKSYHRATLVLCVDEANKEEAKHRARAAAEAERERKRKDDFRRGLSDTSRDIEF